MEIEELKERLESVFASMESNDFIAANTEIVAIHTSITDELTAIRIKEDRLHDLKEQADMVSAFLRKNGDRPPNSSGSVKDRLNKINPDIKLGGPRNRNKFMGILEGAFKKKGDV